MPIGLAVFQGSRQPLDGLCAQLRCAGHEVLAGCDLSAMPGSIDDRDIDLVMIDADWREAKSVLESVEASPSLDLVPIMLVTAEAEKAKICSSWSERIRDIVLLPADSNDLRRRVNNLSRLVAMTAECQHRWAAIADFGIAPPSHRANTTNVLELSTLIVGPTDGQQVELLKAFDGRMTASYATSVAEAIAQIGRSPPDAILVTSAMSATKLRSLFRRIKSTPDWCDLPILVIAETPSPPIVEAVSPWGEAEFLPPSTHPAITHLRLRTLANQWRLRRQLRGLMVNRLLAPIMDGLTGLFGHSFLHHYVDSSIDDHRRRGAPLAVVVCALSGLSQINATCGYPAGDRLLVDIALKIVGGCRAQDLVARLSGCRFALLLNDTSAREAAIVYRRLKGVLEPTLSRVPTDCRPEVRIALGMSEIMDGDVASTLVNRAYKSAALQHVSRAS